MALAALVNVTIDDTSSLIAYSPPDSWRSSSEACKTCLEPDKRLAYAWTWHDGTHIIPTVDADDLPNNAVSPSPTPSPSAGGDGDSTDPIRMTCQWLANRIARPNVPHANRLVPRGGDDPLPVGKECNRTDPTCVTS